jgi:hypothetical protein
MFVMYCVPSLAGSHLPLRTFFHAGCSVPLDLRIRRILFPADFVSLSTPPQHTGDDLDLGNTVGVTEDHTDLRGGGTLLCELADLVNDLVGGGLEPGRGGARVGERRGADTLSLGMKTTHFDGIC